MSEFKPPIISSEIVSYHEDDGEVDRATLQLIDSGGKSFSLTVETQNEFEERVSDEVTSGIESTGNEPVFLVPDKDLTPDIINEILEVQPRLLGRFLVEQDSILNEQL